MSLTDLLGDRFQEAMAAEFGPEYATADPVVRPAEPRFGDFQVNAAMGLAKRVGLASREVAQRLAERARLDDVCLPPDVAGPGFINLRLRDDFLGRALQDQASDPRLGVRAATPPDVVVIDYSSPNVAKEMHVGHLRSTVIGDAIARTLRLAGHRVVPQNHIGDWGTQFGMLIEHIESRGLGGGEGLNVADLNVLYREAQEQFEGNEEFAERARRRVVALQAGDPATLATWQALVEESKRHFRGVYDRLGVTIVEADARPESSYNDQLAGVCEELEGKGLAVISEGALCVFLDEFRGRDGQPVPLIIRKSDGGYGYATTDLAAIRHRLVDLGADRAVYVTDARQAQHFAMIFAAARAAGWVGDGVRLEHVPFGTILGDDGKPFRTRSGEVVRLADLLEEAERRAEAVVAERSPDLDPAARGVVAHIVGIGAVKYADLATDRVRDYVFSLDRMLSLDGNTGPYLQYAYARTASILRRAAADGHIPADAPPAIGEPAEHALARVLLLLPDAVAEVARDLEPHRLCAYLFELATTFTTFYETCNVLRAEEPMRSSRLALCALTGRVLKEALGALGIEVLGQV